MPTPDIRPNPPGLASYLEREDLVLGCDYRGAMIQGPTWSWDGSKWVASGGCGCTRTWHCGAARGTFKGKETEVSYDECLACVAGP